MKFKSLVFLSSILLSGCAATAEDYARFNPDNKYAQDNCTGNFKTYTFGDSGVHKLNIEMLQVNHVGQKFVKVKRGLNVRFLYPWISAEHFTDIKCEKNSESIFSEA